MAAFFVCFSFNNKGLLATIGNKGQI